MSWVVKWRDEYGRVHTMRYDDREAAVDRWRHLVKAGQPVALYAERIDEGNEDA